MAITDVGATVLIVEDDEATAELERRALVRSGMTARTVGRVTDAVDLLHREPFAAVLLDYQLPDGDPWLVLEQAQHRVPRVPVIIVTAMGNERVAAEAIHRGVTEYVRKTESFWDQLPGIVERVARLAQVEERARKSDALFQLIAQNTSDWIATADLNGVYQYVSPACANMFGYRPEELVGRRALDFVHPEDQSVVENEIASASGQSRETVRLTYRHRHKDESHRWVEAQVTILKDPVTGAPADMLQIIRDVTDRMKAEERVRTEQERLAEAQRIAHLGSWELEVGTGEVSWSDELFKVFGLSKETFVPTFELFLERVHPDDRGPVQEAILKCLDDTQPFSCEYRTVRPGGDIRFVQAFGQVSAGGPGRGVRLAGTAQDITVRKELEAQIEARTCQISTALREKEVLLKEVHHRVKNNLQIISSLLNLQASHLGDPAARAMLAESQGRVHSIALVHEKLYQSANFSVLDFDDYVRALIATLLHALDAANRGISSKVEVEAAALSVDKAIACGLIINELVTNSLKHAFPGPGTGTVSVCFRPHDAKALELLVEDDGVGFPADVDPRHTDSLGLDLVFLLAGQLGAAVDVQREPGTAFRFRFPKDCE